MHSRCHTVEDVTSEIKQSERRLTTTSMSSQAEAQLIKEIEVLKQSVPKAKRFSEIEPEIKDLKAQKNKIWNDIKGFKGQEEVLNREIETIRKEMEQTNAEKNETLAAADKIQEQIEACDQELNALYSKKDEKREAYWKGRYDFKLQREQIMHIEWMQRQKDKVLQNVAFKQEREEERNEAIKNMAHPYAKELDCCDHLIGYMT